MGEKKEQISSKTTSKKSSTTTTAVKYAFEVLLAKKEIKKPLKSAFLKYVGWLKGKTVTEEEFELKYSAFCTKYGVK